MEDEEELELEYNITNITIGVTEFLFFFNLFGKNNENNR